MHARSLPCWNCSSRRLLILAFFFLSSYFFWIFFDRFLFKIPSTSKSAWLPSCGPRAVRSGTPTTVRIVCCQWARCSSSPGSWYWPVHCWRHCKQWWASFCTYNTPSLRGSSPHPASRYGICCLPACGMCVWGRVNLSVGSGDSQLILLLLVVGLSLVPSLVALVPVVPRYAYCSVLAGKR